MAPGGFIEPYPGFGEELFGDTDRDGAVTVTDLEHLGRSAAQMNLRIFVDAAHPAQRSSAMDLDILGVVAAYCPSECYPQLSNPHSNQTATLNCDPCFGDGGGGGGGPPPPTCYPIWPNPCWDLDYCDGDEMICSDGSCRPGTPLDCSDNNPCTNDVCHNNTCVYTPNTGAACANDGKICTRDVCNAGVCTHPHRDGESCTSDGVDCTTDICSGSECVNMPNDSDCDDGDFCTDDDCTGSGCAHSYNTLPCDDGNGQTINDRCNLGVCGGDPDPAVEWPSCPYTFVLDGEGGAQGEPVTSTIRVAVPQGTQLVHVRVYYFSAEYPTYTGEPSEYNDIVHYRIWNENGTISQDTSNVNSLHAYFGTADPFFEDEVSYRQLAETEDSWLDLRASATNISDNQLGSGVRIVVECGLDCDDDNVIDEHRIVSVTWEALPGNAALGNCENNGGKKIFPDHLSPGDTPDPAELRRQVKLVAQVLPAEEGITVHFNLWDVDDPFDQLHGPNAADPADVMPNVSILDADNPTTGSDNRGMWWGNGSLTRTTDAGGRATFTLTVGVQPGDNFRAAAALFAGDLNAVTRADSDALSVTTNAAGKFVPNGDYAGTGCVNWSPMLTVWRKLTLEIDSMDREGESWTGRFEDYFEQDRCVVALVTPDSPGPGFTTVTCGPDPDPNRAGFAGLNFFEGGAFWCADGGPETLIVRSAPSTDSYTLTLWGAPPPGIIGMECKIRDDDPYFGSGPGQLPRLTVLDDNIRTAYRDAYIDVQEAGTSWNLVSLVPWQSHLTGAELQYQYLTLTGISSQWDLRSRNTFWARHVVVCYQSHRNDAGDGDGDESCAISQNCLQVNAPYPVLPLTPPLAHLPQVYGYTWRLDTTHGTAITTVYLETIRDQWIDVTSPLLWQFVAHEVGHKTVDLSGDVADGSHTEGGLMSGEPEASSLQNLSHFRVFTSPTLKRFRNTERW